MTTPTPSPGSSFKDRPLSPHLQVWRWTLTMSMSILHRASGCALAAGTIMVVWWLVAAAQGVGAYDEFTTFATSTIGQLMLFGWSLAIFLHLCSGVRHLIMDTGRLLSIKEADRASVTVLLAAIALTALTWAYIKGML